MKLPKIKENLISSSILFFLCLLASYTANLIIVSFFPDRVVNTDIVFKLIPYNLLYEYISDGLFFTSIFIFIYYYFKPNRERWFEILNMISIFYILRSFMIILTPMMRPTGVDIPSHGFFRDYVSEYGMYPSGHIGVVFLLYLIIDGNLNPTLKKWYLIIFLLSIPFMAMSMGHYSIDIVGGIMLAYIVFNEYQKKKLAYPHNSSHGYNK